MWCALLAPLHLETHFVNTIPWNDIPLLFNCSSKIHIMSVRRSDKQTLAVIVHTIIGILKKIAIVSYLLKGALHTSQVENDKQD